MEGEGSESGAGGREERGKARWVDKEKMQTKRAVKRLGESQRGVFLMRPN
jgi:hypothetical protein